MSLAAYSLSPPSHTNPSTHTFQSGPNNSLIVLSLALPGEQSPLIIMILEAVRGSMKRLTDSKKAEKIRGGW